MTKTGKLKDEMAKIAFGNLELRYATAEAMLKACKEAGLMFARTGVVGDDLEGAYLCKVEEIEI